MKTKIFLIIFLICQLSSYSQSADFFYDKALNLIRAGDFNAGIKHLDTLLSIYKNNINAYSLRGYAKGQIEDFKGALEDFNSLIKIDPQNSAAYDQRGICKKNLGDYQGALTDYNIAISLNPESGKAYSNRAVVKYYFLADTLGACEDWTSSKLIGYGKAFILSQGICPDPRAIEKTAKTLSEADFYKLVKSNKLKFNIPEDYIKTDIKTNGEMPCNFAIINKKLDIEVRYYIESLPAISRKYTDNKINIEQDDIFFMGFKEFTMNVSQGEPDLSSFKKEDVQNEFNANFGLYTNFVNNPDYAGNFNYCQMILIHKENVADFYISFLFNDKENFHESVSSVYYALKFEQ